MLFNRVFSSYSHPCKCGTTLSKIIDLFQITVQIKNQTLNLSLSALSNSLIIHHINDFSSQQHNSGIQCEICENLTVKNSSGLYPEFSTWNCDTEIKAQNRQTDRLTDRPECRPAVLWVDHEATFTGEHGSPPRQPLPADPIHPILLQTQWQLTVGVLKRS